MYILLTGGVSILNQEGVRVASILPVTTICEMGVITGELRSATVEVNTPSNIFVLPKKRFDHILAEDDGVRSLLYRNVISVMATKLQNDNSRMADLKGEIEEERARTKAAVNMAASLGNLTADEVENRLIHQEENIESEAIDVATGH
jgi:CRP-like cAMP-binding protein